MKWAHFWRGLDQARIVPRMCLGFYVYQMWHTQQWFELLKEPSTTQAAFTVTVWGAFPILLNFYMQQGTDWQKALKPAEPHNVPV